MRHKRSTPLWKLVSVHDVAKVLGIHPMTVYRLAQRGQIPAIKLGGRWRFRSDLMTSWMEREMERQQEARKQWYPKVWSRASSLPR